jgi:hypothetical protein
MSSILRTWKCRHCGRANSTEIGLEGTGTCTHCAAATQVQPSRIRNGVILPATFPSRVPGARPLSPAEEHGLSESRPRR